MAYQADSEVKDSDNNVSRLPSLLLAIGILCLIMGAILLASTLFMETSSSEFFSATLFSAILGGLSIFFRGNGYYLLPTKERDRPVYLGSPVLYQIVGVLEHILFFLVAYNGLLIVDGVNLDYDFFVVMGIFFSPYVISTTTIVWTRLRYWIWELCKWEP